MQCIQQRSNRVRNYLDLTIKFHDYSSFFTAFDVANIMQYLKNVHLFIVKLLVFWYTKQDTK